MSGIKEFFKEWKGKNLKDKDYRTNILFDHTSNIVEFYIKKGFKAQEMVDELFDKMEDEKFVKTLLRIMKTSDATPVDIGMATVISDFLRRRRENLDEDIIESYKKAVHKLLKKRIKELKEEVKISDQLATELLVVLPEPEMIQNEKLIAMYVFRILSKFYALAKDNDLGIEKPKQVKKIFKALFGKKLLEHVAVNILLERKENIRNFNDNQLAMWNVMTNFALATIEKNEKEDVKQIIKYYVTARAKDAEKKRDVARRIQFAQISEEDFPTIMKVVAKLAKDEDVKAFL